MAARLAAVLVAIAMVAVAFVARDRLDDSDGEDGGRSGPLVLGCVTELNAVCEALLDVDGIEVRVGQAGEVATALADPADASSLDAWLTLAPWPGLVDSRRQHAGASAVFDGSATVARSPLVMVIWPDRAATLARRCVADVGTWRCLGDAAAAGGWAASGGEASWGAVKLGLADPATSGIGALVLAQATLGWFDRDDVSLFDLETDDGYRRWLTGLEAAVRSRSGGELEQMLLAPAALDAVAATEARAVELLSRLASGRRRPEVIYPPPMATADVVLATIGDRGGRLEDAVADRLARALADAGWRVPGEPRPIVPEDPALPASNGLPPGDVLDALRTAWAEVAR